VGGYQAVPRAIKVIYISRCKAHGKQNDPSKHESTHWTGLERPLQENRGLSLPEKNLLGKSLAKSVEIWPVQKPAARKGGRYDLLRS